jgi:hypothetical protein
VSVAEYGAATTALTTLVQAQTRDLLSAFGPSSDPRVVRDALLQFFPDFMTAYGDTAAVLGADLYDALRNLPPSAGTVQTVFAQPAKVKQSEGSVRWAVGALFAPEPSWDTFESNLLGAAQRLVLLPARETIDLLAQLDARSGKVAATGWSRQTNPSRAKSGKSCDFCVMLAGRGPVYRSAAATGAVVGTGSTRTGFDAAGNRLAGGFGGGVRTRGNQAIDNEYHDNCHCTPVPTFYTIEKRTITVRGFTRPQDFLVPIS